MATVVSKATGGKTKPGGLLHAEPSLQVLDAGSGTRLEETGLDPAFTADLLSACLAHERGSAHLYRTIAARAASQDLRERYRQLGTRTLERIRILEELITGSGGEPGYISPLARAAEQSTAGLVESTFLVDGSMDPISAELAMLDAVVVTEAKAHANWELLSKLALLMEDGPVRRELAGVAGAVLAREDEQHGWARDTRTQLLLSLSSGTGIAGLEAVVDIRTATSETEDDG